MKLLISVAAAAALLANVGAAHAAVTFTGTIPASVVTETFDNTTLNPLFGLAGVYSVVQGSVSGQYATPYQDTTKYLTVYGGNTATFTLTKSATFFGFQWGSVDTYNTVKFYNGDELLATFTGSDIKNVSYGSWEANGTVYAGFTSDALFNKVIISSNGNSFEIDNVSVSAVPLPAALPLFGSAILLAAFAFRRKKQDA